jgi:hypothetical protein
MSPLFKKISTSLMAVFNDPKYTPAFKAGYGSTKKARATLKRLRRATRKKAQQVARTMYYRAKYHKYQTPGMKGAMKVYGEFLKTH